MSTNSTNIIQLNFTGFSTRVFIENKKVSATDISLSASENLISFEGAYGGSMNYGTNFRLNTPSFYELPEVSCSIGCEMTYEQIKTNFFEWLTDRGKARRVNISSGKKENQTFNFHECYFKSLKLSASENTLVTANYDFFVLSNGIEYDKVYKFDEGVETDEGDVLWIANSAKESDSSNSYSCSHSYSHSGANYTSYSFFDEPLRVDLPWSASDPESGYKYAGMIDPTFDMKTCEKEGDENKTPIGYWETSIDGFGTEIFDEDGNKTYSKYVVSWDLNISQNIIPKYYCGRSSDDEIDAPVLPDIMIGYPKMELTVNFMIDKNDFDERVFNFNKGKTTVYYYNPSNDSSSSSNSSSSIDIGSSRILTLRIREQNICNFICGRVTSYAPSLSPNGAITFSVSYLINQIQLY